MPYRRTGGKRKGRSNVRLNGVFLWFLLIITILLFAYYFLNRQIYPVVKTLAVNKAKNAAVDVINSSVGAVLQRDAVSYDSLMNYERDDENRIVAIESDSYKMNRLKTDVIKEVLTELSSLDGNRLDIPIGNLFGGVLLTDKGPRIRISITPTGSANADFTSVFTAAGINQTHQQIMLKIQVNILIIISSCYTVSETVSSNLCIAETIIVGNVPDSYFNFGS